MKFMYGAVVTMAILAIPAFSQEQIIDEFAFNAGMRRSQRPVSEWQDKARRIIKTTEEEFSNLPGMDHRYKDVIEYDTTGASRSSWEAVTGKRGLSGEVIRVGNLTFTRDGIEKWAKKEVSEAARPKATLPFEGNILDDPKSYSSWHEPGSSVEYKLRTAEFRGDEVLVYRRVMTLTWINQKDGSEIKKETINHYWINARGRIVKLEQWINHTGKDLYGRQKTVIEWDLDPKIVVTVPAVLR